MFKTILSSLLLSVSLITAAHASGDPLDKIASLCSYDNVVYYGESDRAGNSYYLLCKTPTGIDFTYGKADTLAVEGHRTIPERDITPIIGHNSGNMSTVIQFTAANTMVKIGNTNSPDYDVDLNAIVVYTNGKMSGKTFLTKRSVINGIRQMYDDSY